MMDVSFANSSRDVLTYALGFAFVPLVPWATRKFFSTREPAGSPGKLSHLGVIVINPQLDGRRIDQLVSFGAFGVVISRRKRHGRVEVARPRDVIRLGDILLAVGLPEELEDFRLHVGKACREDLRAARSHVVMQPVAVTKISALGRKLGTMKFLNSGEVRVTRLVRARTEFLATPDQRLCLGDILLLVGYSESVAEAAASLGRVSKFAP